LANRLAGALITYRGPHADWETAKAATAGYDNADILKRVVDATGQVLRGDADYEQDGVPMHGMPPASHALASLLMAAALDAGKLSVLDFGGGLGSHYLKWRRWFTPLDGMHWCVVEQPHFVAAGEQLFKDNSEISFAQSIEQAAAANAPNAVIASSVLQYLPEPLPALDALIAIAPRLIVIDRTPFGDDGSAHVMSQHVPRHLGTASYPLWLLSRVAIHARLRERYVLLAEFTTADAPLRAGRISGDYLGCIWLRKD
jgi:putative methyltransferase (TIGR04325 family)